jgi:probable H4MPT-linked C1 transfer pathway protein
MCCLAFDVGGANLKAADGRGFACNVPFELWRNPHGLADALDQLLRDCPVADKLAVTMTGELADCFSTKSEGVWAILDAVERVAPPRPVVVYLSDGRLVNTATARPLPLLAAASNWHALASFAGRYVPSGAGIVIDIGSTTMDVIPLIDSKPATIVHTDPERLLSSELVYTGVARSPVCALVKSLPWRGRHCPVAQEVFATTLDVYVTLGQTAEDPNNFQTADGGPSTIDAARNRLARAICCDRTMFSPEDAMRASEAVRSAQLDLLECHLKQVLLRQPQPVHTVILSGSGEFLARDLLKRIDFHLELISMTEQLGLAVSQCAPAHALAVLAAENNT